MRGRIVIAGIIAAAILAVLAIIFIPRFLESDGISNQTYFPTNGWRTSTPEKQGFDSNKLAEELHNLQESNPNIHSLLIIRNGYVILDAYFYPYDNTIPHKLASVTKSFTTTVIGIAIDQGKINLDQPMVSFFPNRTIANLDDLKKMITVRHLVSNMNGLASGCFGGDEPTLNAMRSNPDWVQAALDRKVVEEPGTSFCYDSPGMHLLSAILQKATGMTELEFAEQNLFKPLGINEVKWQSDPQGYTHGWGDLFLKPRDAAKIGYLWLNKGVWEGKQIVSSAWVADSVTAHSYGGMDAYGYGWWISNDSYYAFGRGGQNIKVYPAYNAIVVTTGIGFEYDQINPLLEGAFVDPNNPLPANPVGVAQLKSTVTTLAQSAQPWPNNPIPDTAKEISGKTYGFGSNIVNVATLRLEFSNNTEAKMYLNLEGRDVVWPIGLDGKYRLELEGLALRGYWADDHTFVFDIFEDELSTIKLYFENEGVILEVRGMKFEGQLINP